MTPHPHNPTQAQLEPLIGHVRTHFYAPPVQPRKFHQDKKMLLYALTWPATWLCQRNLKIDPAHYNQIILQRLRDIQLHGDPARYRPCFPRYLLKVLQDHFRHHHDRLYNQLKHASFTFDFIIAELQKMPDKSEPPDLHLEVLAQTHLLLRRQYQANNQSRHHKQMTLPL